MLNISEIIIETERLIISQISKNSYESITKLYADSENNGYATGIFGEISEDEVEKRISTGDNTKNVFSLAVESRDKKDQVGYIRGSLSEIGNAAWIYTLIISEGNRRKGYGTETVRAVEELLRREYGVTGVWLSVLDENIIGKKFWEALGYEVKKTMMKSGIVENAVSKINIYVKLF